MFHRHANRHPAIRRAGRGGRLDQREPQSREALET